MAYLTIAKRLYFNNWDMTGDMVPLNYVVVKFQNYPRESPRLLVIKIKERKHKIITPNPQLKPKADDSLAEVVFFTRLSSAYGTSRYIELLFMGGTLTNQHFTVGDITLYGLLDRDRSRPSRPLFFLLLNRIPRVDGVSRKKILHINSNPW